MLSMIAFCACFVLAFFSINVTGCPSWGDGINIQTTGCPNLYKEQSTNVSFYDPSELEVRSNGRGQCAAFGTIQCWPLFRQPFYEDTGEDATYYYRQWVAKVDERVVIYPQFEEPYCDTSDTLTFREPVDSGTCLKPTPTPTPTPTPSSCPDNCPNPQQYAPATCFGPVDWCQYPDTGCEPGLQENGRCCCSWNTPILIDVSGNGFSLTSAEDGVVFDITGRGAPEQISWTASNSDDAFLGIDRNGNGVIDNGFELFGNTAPQPQPTLGTFRNGFFALAEYDKPANGGNDDGLIDQQDAVYGTLLLWRDLNHNGICEPTELDRLVDRKVETISLDFQESKHRDKWGNGFRYRSRVTGNGGRWAYDVVLQNIPRP